MDRELAVYEKTESGALWLGDQQGSTAGKRCQAASAKVFELKATDVRRFSSKFASC